MKALADNAMTFAGNIKAKPCITFKLASFIYHGFNLHFVLPEWVIDNSFLLTHLCKKDI